MNSQQTASPVQNPFAAGCGWVEGRYLPISEVRIPILDTGFLRSDLTYDVVAVWEGRFFRLDDHLERLFAGCRRIRLTPSFTKADIRTILIETVRLSGIRNAYVEAIITRGVARAGERDPRLLTPSLYAYAIPYVWIVPPESQLGGTDVVIARNTFRIPPGAVDPTVKNFHWGDLIRGVFEAYDRGAWLPILPSTDGMVTEGPGFNVFAYIDDVLRTPGSGVLEGITRRTVIEIAREDGMHVTVGDIVVDDLYRATELFLSSTGGGVMPVATLDGRPVGNGCPGPVTMKIRDRYWELHHDPRYTYDVDYPDGGSATGTGA
jgi:branched-subunit amino acid aminotransferase/4-amino-4-deoxychorismate lyase